MEWSEGSWCGSERKVPLIIDEMEWNGISINKWVGYALKRMSQFSFHSLHSLLTISVNSKSLMKRNEQRKACGVKLRQWCQWTEMWCMSWKQCLKWNAWRGAMNSLPAASSFTQQLKLFRSWTALVATSFITELIIVTVIKQ